MKLEYQKPYLAVESFQLNAAIAGSCAGKTILAHSVDDCTFQDAVGPTPGVTYFGAKCASEPGGLDIVNTNNGDSICYQSFADIVGASFVDS